MLVKTAIAAKISHQLYCKCRHYLPTFYAGVPSLLMDVAFNSTTNNTPSVAITVLSNGSTNTGNGLPIQSYNISLPEVDFSVTVGSCNDSSCSYTITANDSDMRFNTPYMLEVTSINTCGLESSPLAGETVEFIAHGEYQNILHSCDSHSSETDTHIASMNLLGNHKNNICTCMCACS